MKGSTRFVRVYNIKIDERLLTLFARLSFDVHKEEEEKVQKMCRGWEVTSLCTRNFLMIGNKKKKFKTMARCGCKRISCFLGRAILFIIVPIHQSFSPWWMMIYILDPFQRATPPFWMSIISRRLLASFLIFHLFRLFGVSSSFVWTKIIFHA